MAPSRYFSVNSNNKREKTPGSPREIIPLHLCLHPLLPTLLIRSRDASLSVPLRCTTPLTCFRCSGFRYLRRRLRGKFLPSAAGCKRQQTPSPLSSSAHPPFPAARMGGLLAGAFACRVNTVRFPGVRTMFSVCMALAFLRCAGCFPAVVRLLSASTSAAFFMPVRLSGIIREGQPTFRIDASRHTSRLASGSAPSNPGENPKGRKRHEESEGRPPDRRCRAPSPGGA